MYREDRSFRLQIFLKIGVLKNFINLKHLCWSLILIKLQAIRPTTLLKRDSNEQVFSCDICGIFKSTFFTEPVGWLLLRRSHMTFVISFMVDLSFSFQKFFTFCFSVLQSQCTIYFNKCYVLLIILLQYLQLHQQI